MNEHESLDGTIAQFLADAPPDENPSTEYFQQRALRIANQGNRGFEFLAGQVMSSEENRARAAVFALGGVDRNQVHTEANRWIPALLVGRLCETRPLVLMEAIDSLAFLGVRDPAKRIEKLEQHPSPYVRAAALRYRARLNSEDALASLIAALDDEHYIVRETAADQLDQLSALTALPSLKQALNDPHPDVREAARTAVDNITRLSGDTA